MSRNTHRRGPATTDELWKLHHELAVWFRDYLASPDQKSGAVIAEMIRFMSDNHVTVDARTAKELKSHADVLAALTVPFPTATPQ